MVKYSVRALYNRFVLNSWIELCNNDCGTMVYSDIETNTVRNAAAVDEDIVHKEFCDFLKKLKKAARSFNWIPSFAIDSDLDWLFDSLEEANKSHNYGSLMRACQSFRDTIDAQKAKNKEAKEQWDKEKADKLQQKILSPQHRDREVDQLSQWEEYQRQHPKWKIELNFSRAV